MIVKNWKSAYLTPKRAIIVGGACVVTFLLINFQVLFTFGHVTNNNGTESVECYATDVPSTKIMAISQLVNYLIFFMFKFNQILLKNNIVLLRFIRFCIHIYLLVYWH